MWDNPRCLTAITFAAMENEPVRVLIYEDNAALRTSLAALVRSDPDFRLTAALGHCLRAEADVRQLRPDVVLMDIACRAAPASRLCGGCGRPRPRRLS